jgi:trk system potassium uptake protein TrkA
MRVLVLGAGTVGTSIAEMLCENKHSVTVVDHDPAQTRRINDELDVRPVTGSASESSVMFQADVIGADTVLAVTGNDEVNIVAASMAKGLGALRSIARVYAPIFRDLSTFDYQTHFNIDRLMSLEHLTAMELARGIRSPGSVVVENFARGQLEVQEVIVSKKSIAINMPLKDLGLPKGVRIGSIYRGDKLWIAGANDRIEAEDHVMLIGRREDIDDVKESLSKEQLPTQHVVIAGGGETGFHLARTLESDRFHVVLMDQSQERCEFLANNLKQTTVIQADANRRAILEEERVGSADVFVACTGDDENNIMAGVEARDIGAKQIMAIVGRPDYAGLVGKLGIDLAVSERDVMANHVLGFLQTWPVIHRSSLPGGRISVLEIDVLKGAPCTEHVLANLQLPAQCLIAAVITAGYVKVPGADDRLSPGDTVVAMIEDSAIDATLAHFSVNGR